MSDPRVIFGALMVAVVLYIAISETDVVRRARRRSQVWREVKKLVPRSDSHACARTTHGRSYDPPTRSVP